MHYEGNIIRPPSEADSIILQVTVGCSHNRCTFCGAYKDEKFRIKDKSIVDADLDFAARYCRRQKRVFLADGDVLVLSQARLLEIFSRIRSKLPWVNRISLYANAKSIRQKTSSQLAELKELGLDRVYLGLETGHDPTLLLIKKGADAEALLLAGQKVREAGLFLSVTVLLGIAGVECSLAHAEATGRLLTAMAPNQIAALTLMLMPNTILYQDKRAGRFSMVDPQGMLRELYCLVDNIMLDRVMFQSNHASNYLPINCRLSRDKQDVLALIGSAIKGDVQLKPERMRAL
ncbi:MAG: radical SAM protein [Proteobacteria bacterium]|nr:radical SAM protein [Pseudomonadota bacterium]MBU1714788.1 radical SAM protein [Pseudomonadota bacterium]